MIYLFKEIKVEVNKIKMNQLQQQYLIHSRKCHGCRQDLSSKDLV